MNFTTEQLTTAIANGIAQGLALEAERKSQEMYVDTTYAALIGKLVFIRTVTMTNVGVLASVEKEAFILEQGAVWIANTGNWEDFCNKGTADDVAKFGPHPVYVAKGGVIDIQEMPRIPSSKR